MCKELLSILEAIVKPIKREVSLPLKEKDFVSLNAQQL